MNKTVNISFSEKDLERIDLYCSAHNLTRSKYVVQCAIQCLEAEELVNATVLLNKTLSQFKDTGVISESDSRTIEAFERLLGGRK